MKSAGVWFPPPLIFVITFLAGWMVEKQLGRLTLTNNAGVIQALQVIGVVMIAVGIALVAWGIITFSRAKTAVYPNQPATRIVDSGPYRFTRNPMYSGLTIAYLGVAWMLNMGWPMILLPLALVVLHHFVIAREERYLASAFGETYESYRKRVNRWL
jgi:protein-S-isoprenylcysteine O-methyltransferase Ste14